MISGTEAIRYLKNIKDEKRRYSILRTWPYCQHMAMIHGADGTGCAKCGVEKIHKLQIKIKLHD